MEKGVRTGLGRRIEHGTRGFTVNLFMAAVGTTVGCNKEPIVLVVSGGFAAEYARTGCRQAADWQRENGSRVSEAGCGAVADCPEMMTGLEACRTDPAEATQTLASQLMTNLGSDRACAGVRLLRDDVPEWAGKVVAAMNGQHWTLSLYYRPGAQDQEWKLYGWPEGGQVVGRGSASEIAHAVCFALRERGERASK
jgi:hypothetical protein